MTKLSKIKI